MKKNVLILASVSSMIQQFLIPNIKLLIQMNYKVHVACNFIDGNTIAKDNINNLKNLLESLDVTYHQIDFKRNVTKIIDNIKAYDQTVKLMKIYKFEFIHCHTPIGGVCGRLASKKTNTKCIYTAHGFHFYKGAPLINWLIYYSIEKWLSRYTDCLITINNEDYELAVNKKFKAKNIKLIHGVGIDLDKFKPITQEAKNELRLEYGFNSDDFILIFAGEINKNKNQDLIISVVDILKNKIPNLKVLFAGLGVLMNHCQNRINELGLNDNILLLGFRNDINKLMLISDIAVSSSKREGLPVNIMEAMASGLPLVVTNCKGNRDLVKNNVNGFVVDIDDVDDFANKIEIIYNDEKLKLELSENSLLNIKDLSLEKILIDMTSVYSLYL